MQQRSGKIYLQAKEEIIKPGKLGKVTLARTWWHGNGAHLMKAPEKYRTQPSDLDWARYPGTGEMARLGSAAVLQFPRISGFRRRTDHGSVHALDRRGPHVHGAGQSDRG